MNKKLFYDEVFMKKRGILVDTDSIIFDIENNNNYYEMYQGEMFCPECYTAKLVFVSKSYRNNSYIKCKNGEIHSSGCSYQCDEASSKMMKDYFDSLTAYQIDSKLNILLNRLCRKDNLTFKKIHLNPEESPLLFKSKNNSLLEKKYKLLRQKKINLYPSYSLEKGLYVFYGQVRLNISDRKKKDTNEPYQILEIQVYSQYENTYKTSYTIFYKDLNLEFDSDKKYNIVLIATPNIEYRPYSLKLYKNSIKIEEVK